jgi:hypothetical protein
LSSGKVRRAPISRPDPQPQVIPPLRRFLSEGHQKELGFIVPAFDPALVDTAARSGRTRCDHKHWQAKSAGGLGGTNLRPVTSGRPTRPRVVVEHSISGELVCVVAAGVEQADSDASGTINAPGAFYIYPDALRAAIHAELAKQLCRKSARSAGRPEAGWPDPGWLIQVE